METGREQEFVGAIRGLEKVERTTFHEGLLCMEFTEAASRAAAGGGTAILPRTR
jgi:hypothetical protein